MTSQTEGRFRTGRRAGALLISLHAVALGLAFPLPRSASAQAGAGAPEKRVSVDVTRGDVEDVIKALAFQSGRNIIVLPSVKGAVTITLKQGPLTEVLRTIAAIVGAEVREFNGNYYVGSPTELRGVVARTGVKEVVSVRYAKVDDVVALLQAAYPYLTVEQVGKANVLLLNGATGDVAAAKGQLRELDVEPPRPPIVPQLPPQRVRETRILKSIKVAEAVETVRRAVPELTVDAVETTRTLILTGFPSELAVAQKLLESLDVERPAGTVVRIYPLKYLHPLQATQTLQSHFAKLKVTPGFESYVPDRATFTPLGQETSQAFNQAGLSGGGGGGGASGGGAGGSGGSGGAGGGAGGSTGVRSRELLIAGPEEEVNPAFQLLTQLDVAPPQVLIEARVVDSAPSVVRDLGFRYNFTGFSLQEPGAQPLLKFGPYTRSPFNVDVLFNAQDTTTDFKVLARPNVSVVDGEEASIFIGDIIRYERLTSVTDNGQQQFSIESVPVGVALLCRPRVNMEKGDITLRLHPVVSSLTAFTGRRNDIPQTSTRETESTIVLKDGETLAIGGLLRDEEIKTLTQVPFLSRIPFFGELFKHRRTSKRKSEVTIFMTVKLMKPVA